MTNNEIFDIEQVIGIFFNALYENDVDVITNLFTEDAELVFPDLKLNIHGDSYKNYWQKVCEERQKKQVAAFFIPCNIYLEKRQKFYYGEWDTYSFRSEKEGCIQYFLTHVQAHFVKQSDQWKIIYFCWNEVLELCPWKLEYANKITCSGNLEEILSEDEELTADDYLKIRNLQGHFTHQGMNCKENWFAKRDDVRLNLPTVFDCSVKGYEAVAEQLHLLKAKMLKNDKNYVFLPLVGAPVITGNSKNANGRWLGLVFEVQAQAYGVKNPPYAVKMYAGVFKQRFVKIENEWKFQEFNHEILFETYITDYEPEKMMRHRMREKIWEDTWMEGPEMKNGNCPEDVGDIEVMLAQWTGRIRSGNSLDFVKQYMMNSKEQISMLVAGSTQKRTTGYAEIEKRFGPRERTGRRENPAYHTLSTPVIEFSEDGNYASAAWTDLAIADFSGAFDFPLSPVCYHMTVNKYYHEFVRDIDGRWKLYAFGWEPGLFIGGLRFEETLCRGFYKGWSNTKYEFPITGEAFKYE